MTTAMSFSAAVRDELAHVQDDDPGSRRAELAAALRVAAALRIGHGRVGFVLTTPSGAVARRLRSALAALTGSRPRVEVHRPQGLSVGVRYRLVWDPIGPAGPGDLGLLDEHGHPVDGLPAVLATAPAAGLRGALMVGGSVSNPGTSPHLEIAAPGRRSAEQLAALLRDQGATGARAHPHGEGWRAVVKSGAGVATVLVRSGAHTAFLRYDQGRLRRELRVEANRAANADGANVRRSVAAAARQIEVAHAALGGGESRALPPELLAVALARVANPQASLGELGALLSPPVGKVTVHRRLARLEALSRQSAVSGGAAQDPDRPAGSGG